MLLRVQDMVTLESVLFTICGLLGGPGNVDGSGALKKLMFGLVGSSSRSAPLHVALPLREDATHVYIPPSRFSRSAKVTTLD